jgi:hypothetical protein
MGLVINHSFLEKESYVLYRTLLLTPLLTGRYQQNRLEESVIPDTLYENGNHILYLNYWSTPKLRNLQWYSWQVPNIHRKSKTFVILQAIWKFFKT